MSVLGAILGEKSIIDEFCRDLCSVDAEPGQLTRSAMAGARRTKCCRDCRQPDESSSEATRTHLWSQRHRLAVLLVAKVFLTSAIVCQMILYENGAVFLGPFRRPSRSLPIRIKLPASMASDSVRRLTPQSTDSTLM